MHSELLAEDVLLKFSEAAERLRVSARTIRRLVDAGDIEAIRVGGQRFVRVLEVRRVAREGTGKPALPAC